MRKPRMLFRCMIFVKIDDSRWQDAYEKRIYLCQLLTDSLDGS